MRPDEKKREQTTSILITVRTTVSTVYRQVFKSCLVQVLTGLLGSHQLNQNRGHPESWDVL